MPGPLPKPASTRARRNQSSTATTLYPVSDPVVPGLPSHTDWHEAVEMWWHDIWSSPMSTEWTDSDVHNLFIAARLMNLVWSPATSAAEKVSAANAIRQQLRECGLSPMSRRTLQWVIDRGEEAQQRTDERRRKATQEAAQQVDPRQGLRPA